MKTKVRPEHTNETYKDNMKAMITASIQYKKWFISKKPKECNYSIDKYLMSTVHHSLHCVLTIRTNVVVSIRVISRFIVQKQSDLLSKLCSHTSKAVGAVAPVLAKTSCRTS